MFRIICPHCMKELKDTDICFESIRTATAAKDEVKLRFLKRYNQEINENDLSAMSQTIVRFTNAQKDSPFEVDPRSSTPVAWRELFDGNTYLSRVRVCSYCHMPLPIKAGHQEMISIGFAGNSNAGKTVYLLSLIHDLSQKLGGFSLTPDPAFFSGGGNQYKQLYQEMYEPRRTGMEGPYLHPSGDAFLEAPGYLEPTSAFASGFAPYYLPEATKTKDRLMPIVLNCNCNGKAFILVLFDMAGEGVRSELYLEVNAEYLKHADGVIYLKDPEYLPILNIMGNILGEYEYLDRIMEGINRDAYIAITTTKFDLLERKRSQAYDRIIASHFVNNGVSPHQHGFKDADMRVMNARLKKLFEEPEYKDTIILNVYRNAAGGETIRRGLFGHKKVIPSLDDRVVLFAASALGCHAQVQQDINRRNYMSVCPSGVRNVDPVAWVLNKYGLFPSAAEDDGEGTRL